jgi:hypothetical protein
MMARIFLESLAKYPNPPSGPMSMASGSLASLARPLARKLASQPPLLKQQQQGDRIHRVEIAKEVLYIVRISSRLTNRHYIFGSRSINSNQINFFLAKFYRNTRKILEFLGHLFIVCFVFIKENPRVEKWKCMWLRGKFGIYLGD